MVYAGLGSAEENSRNLMFNKYDLNIEKTIGIESFAKENNLGIIGRIPFDPVFTKAMI